MIPLIKPYIDFADVENDFRAIFDSGMFTKGENVAAFREEFASYVGAKHCHFTTSATTALWTCLKLLDIGVGDDVIVSDFSFPASSNVIEDLGARPVFADVRPDTYNMCPDALQAAITDKTRAVMFVDALGNPDGLTQIQKICRNRNLPLIEDAACAIGSAEHGTRCGAIADLTCFSFHPRKLLCTGEGGAIITNNDAWNDWLQVKLNHGASGMKGVALDFPDYGYNFRLTEIQAAMGRRLLPMIDDIIAERQAQRDVYIEKLAPLGFTPQQSGDHVNHNMQSVVFTVPDNVDRDGLIATLKEQGAETSIGTYALSSMTYNLKRYNTPQPTAKMLFDRTITLPCYHGVDMGKVVEAIKTNLL